MAEPGNLTVVDVRIPFWRMVMILLKVALAIIPAALLFSLIITVIAFLLRATWFGLMMKSMTI